MSKKVAAVWLSFAMVFSSFMIVDIITDFTPTVKGSTTFYVNETGSGGAFSSIQDAINASKDGDTVFVYNGTYYENVVVNKTINLMGENKSQTIIEGGKNGATLLIEDYEDVSIMNFSIHNGSRSKGSLKVYNASAEIINCYINGSRGNDDPYFAESGSPGISSLDSSITIMNSSISGGRGGDYTENEFFSRAGNGGEGMTLTNTKAVIIGSQIKGGNGGCWKDQDPWWDDHVGVNGDGNDAVVFEDSDLSISLCEIRSGSGKAEGCFYTQNGNCIDGTNSNLTASFNDINAHLKESGNAIVIDNYWALSDTIVTIEYNQITYSNVGVFLNGVTNSTIEGNLIDKCFTAIKISSCSPIIVNTTISWSGVIQLDYVAFDIRSDSHLVALNTTYEDGDVEISSGSDLTVAWFVSVKVKNTMNEPIETSIVYVNDTYGSNAAKKVTNSLGWAKWMPITQRIITSSSIFNYTPHYISSYKSTLFGDIIPNQTIDRNRNFIIVLDLTSLYLVLEPGWNLISNPLISLNTAIPEIFGSIEEQYNAVNWYNITDTNDHWKYYHTSKPSYMNDLSKIDYAKGFWIHIIDQEGANLVILGNKFNSNQNITLHPGWNLVGYPSLTSYNRTTALNNINFDTDVDAIWTYKAATQQWEELDESDYFEVGRGYWVHSKGKKTWEVPL